MMVQGHTIDAVLGMPYRQGDAFQWWTFVRGLTSCLFLLLAGFAFSVSTGRRPVAPGSGTTRRRAGRLLFLFVLGYALKFPAGSLAGLPYASAQSWQVFYGVDVLQCIAVTLGLLLVIALALRTRAHQGIAAALLAVTVVVVAPWLAEATWVRQLHPAAAAYVAPVTGSLFPVFPWAAYGLLGAALGVLYTERLHSAGLRWLIGAAGVILGVTAALPAGDTSFMLLRAGLVIVVLAAAWLVSRLHASLPFVSVIARESLIVYCVHATLAYGSPWNPGLRQIIGPTLSPAAAAACALGMLASMMALASLWHWCRRTRPATLWALRAGTAAILGIALL